MKRFYFSKLVILSAFLLLWNTTVFAQPVLYNAVGEYTYTVGLGVTSMQIDMAGAQGGTGNSGSHGGFGGRVTATLAVSAGEIINVFVGGYGTNGSVTNAINKGGLNGVVGGGAQGGDGNYQGAGGGGASDIRVGGTALTNRLIVAGAGGGSGQDYNLTTEYGGNGGGLTGGIGYYNTAIQDPCYCGNGGTQTGGGTGSTCYSGVVAGLGAGAGGSYTSWTGGGGGGYYGGGVGYYGGGGGGSSYYGGTGVTLATTTPAYQSGNGYVKITPLSPNLSTTPSSLNFGYVTVGTSSVPQFTIIAGASLLPVTGTVWVHAPAAGYQISTDGVNWHTDSIAITYGTPLAGSFGPINLYVQFIPGFPICYTNPIVVTGGGLPSGSQITLSGCGVTACSGTPTAGTAVVTPGTGGTGTAFVLTLTGNSAAGGLSYQWQSSTTSPGTSGYTNIPGAVDLTYTVLGITKNTWYRCVITCPAGGVSTTSASVEALFSITTPNPCSGTPNPGIAFAPVKTGCSPYSLNLYDIGATTDSAVSHQWQSSTDGLSWVNVINGNTRDITQSISATTYYRDVVTCAISTLSAISSVDTLILNAAPAPITGITTICSATPSALADITASGVWTSSNPGVAQVGSASGIVTGFGAGTSTISYTLPTGCNATVTATVNVSPAPITGSGNVCTGQTTPLGETLAGGTWSSSDGTLATVSAGGVVTGVMSNGVNPIITYAMPSGCNATFTETVNQLPAPVTGSTNVCVGSKTALAEAITGGTWVSNNSFHAAVDPVTGLVSGLVASTPTITYTLPGGCFVAVPVTVNALPAAIAGNTFVCTGGTTALTDGGTGTWSSSNTFIATAGAGTGIISGVASGASTISYTLTSTGCSSTLAMSVVASPAPYLVTGGGGYCAGGTGVGVGLSNSGPSNINYHLYNSIVGLEDTLTGTASGLTFPLQTDTGTYTITATDGTYGCTSNMTGFTTITINQLPNNTYTVSAAGSGAYCQGTAGVEIILSQSDLGISYQVNNGTANVGAAVAGIGGLTPLNLGVDTQGSYVVIATNPATLCQSTLLSGTTISVNQLPYPYSLSVPVTDYCAGIGAGVDVQVSGSDLGINYHLYNGLTLVDTMAGSGINVDFGTQPAGCYTAIAVDGTTGCTTNILGKSCVNSHTAPFPQIMTGGGGYCTGGPGVHIGLNSSITGDRYVLVGAATPDTVNGSNSGLDFGYQSAAGSYTAIAINAFGCISNMVGIKTVTVQPLPNTYPVSANGNYCLGTTGADVQLTIGSDANVKYSLYKGVTSVANKIGTGSALDFGKQPAGTYTIIGVDTGTGCTNLMIGASTITLDSLPHVFTVSGGGHFCSSGAGVDVFLPKSDAATTAYVLTGGGTTFPGVAGTGGLLDFGNVYNSGSYTVVATNGSGCSANMAGSATVVVDPLPALYPVTVSGTGSYCAGGPGLEIDQSVSTVGINYQLWNTTTGSIGLPSLGGTGGKLNFGIHPDNTYYIVATSITPTHCAIQSGYVTINKIDSPTQYTISDSGNYCSGSLAGTDVYLSSSATGINYEIINSGKVLATVPGTGVQLDLGHRLKGTYTAVAIDATYGCTSNMMSSAIVGVNPLPVSQIVTGGGHYCAGGLGVPVGLKNSVSGVNYQLYGSAGVIVGADSAGITGSAISYGLETGADTYTVIATDTTTKCSNNMAGSAVVAIDTTVTPAVTITTPVDTLCKGVSATFSATPVNGGSLPVFQWRVNGANVTGTGSTFTYAPADSDVVTAMLTSNAACPTVDTINSTGIQMIIDTGLIPSVSASTPKTNVCASAASSVTFTAAPTNGGTAPIYEWKKNGAIVGTDATTYTTSVVDSDVIFVIMASNTNCNHIPFVFSAPVTMTVTTPETPAFYISADPGTYITKGQAVTFTAWITNAPDASVTFTYQWAVNGGAVAGATTGVFVSSTLPDNADVTCSVTSVSACGGVTGMHDVLMSVNSLNVVQASTGGDVRIIPNPNKGAFTVKGTIGTASDEEVTLEVTNMLGQVVYNSKVMAHSGDINEQVQLSNALANGMYLLNLRSATATQVFHFVIEQ